MAEVPHSEHNDIFKNERAASIAYQSMLVHVSDRWRLGNNSVLMRNENNKFTQMGLYIPVSDKRLQLESVKTGVQAHQGGGFRDTKGYPEKSCIGS